ncbi:MAG: hypothetical protein ABSA70_12485 [Terriglobia bacterium]
MPRPLIRRLAFVTPLILFLVSPACSYLGERKPDRAPNWKVKVLSVTSPSDVPVARRSPFGGTQPAAAEAAPAGSRWVVVNIELTAPSVGASLEPEWIKVIDQVGSGHAVLALISTPASGQAAEYLYFKDSGGLGVVSKEGGLLWVFQYGHVSFHTTSPQKVSLLFSLPSATRPATLVVGNSGTVDLPREK